ncbi:MAG: cell filamentation protein Fic [Candidatus Magasanikbacteria bacterium CG_4_9_14_0_2_um_filter_42_11]|uniref:Cell filamentation protein Fic n=1 Tax=Candidatus Magasanikbacteria bacterium CG_4_9_14_0_2_um_filter_42_11 TaxID=1974643 RepID=A0A2M8F9F9_9BACT|nr:MAG: cell filamentation protein Fic [Candidatus Magasanikbacteria bacterium CG10_big_fil_rev_8_21_14_0_10_43_9]PIY92437.1 MAG: cell filamentation protein Fic [Candidatus Magasanikbacteria bacterium CG_4_10_14_0_8_um_filter_42_12]PJC52375.1 MAG: cell filamentation protein Fic [Candidatus Magasanikbacteria bacterium CG_4_9_14_0_2_um_filter_42_11]
MPYLDQNLVDRLDKKLKQLNSLRPLPKTAVEKLRDQLRIEMTYNSNAIEGNSLTLKETFLVINEGLTVKGKPLKDHLEAKDHYSALSYLYELIKHGKKNTLSEHLIKQIHTIIVQETDKEWAGRYRNSNVIIGGADHTPPDALDVPTLMRDLITWFSKERKNMHVVELAALIHHKFVYIHPFFDGNGRTSHLLMNLILMQAGFPLSIVLKNDRKKYYRVLAQADKEQYEPFVRFIAQTVEHSLDLYLKTLTPTTKKRETFLKLADIAKDTPYSAKYLNLLARQGKLEAHKEGRNWVTTQEAVERYMKGRERQRDV